MNYELGVMSWGARMGRIFITAGKALAATCGDTQKGRTQVCKEVLPDRQTMGGSLPQVADMRL